MTNPQTEFDSPWKDILQLYFENFIMFFFPQVHGEINWTRTPKFLDKELQQVMRDAELGRRLADKLVKMVGARSQSQPICDSGHGAPSGSTNPQR